MSSIDTPASLSQQAADDSADKVICKLCRRQYAKYTCPSCNVPYCSLPCFRSSSHTNCSESFYKNQLRSDIATAPARTTQERKQMVDLLKRFEEDAAADEELWNKKALEASDNADSADTLVTRFAGINIDSLSPEDMWQMLTHAQRDKFRRALADPMGELAQDLLSSEVLETELEQPWWTKEDQVPAGAEVKDGDKHSAVSKPEPIPIPQSMIKPIPHGHPLVYNLCAICIAYSFTIRRLGIDMLSNLTWANPDYIEALRLIKQLVPFLLDRRSTALHPGVEAVVTDVYSRFETGRVNSGLFAMLLKDTSKLISPLRVLPLSSAPPVPSQSAPTGKLENGNIVDLSTHAHVIPVLVLSDLIRLFQPDEESESRERLEESLGFASRTRKAGQEQAPNAQSKKQPGKSKLGRAHEFQHVVRKLEFYVAHTVATPSGILTGVAEEVLQWSEKVGSEAWTGKEAPGTAMERL